METEYTFGISNLKKKKMFLHLSIYHINSKYQYSLNTRSPLDKLENTRGIGLCTCQSFHYHSDHEERINFTNLVNSIGMQYLQIQHDNIFPSILSFFQIKVSFQFNWQSVSLSLTSSSAVYVIRYTSYAETDSVCGISAHNGYSALELAF